MSEKNPQNWRGMQMDDGGATAFTRHDFSNDTFEDTKMAGLDYSFSRFRNADLQLALLTGSEKWENCDFYKAKVQAPFLAVLKKTPGVTLPDGTRVPAAPPPAPPAPPAPAATPAEAPKE